MMQAKPKLRTAPTLEELAEKQAATERLLKLSAWAEEPNNPPAAGTAAVIPTASTAPGSIKKVKPIPVVPPKPWDGPDASKSHPYHVVCSEALFQKMDFVWKRKGSKSMREWILNILEHEANKALKDLGEH